MLALGLPALRVLVEGHARVDAAEERRSLTGVRAAVWAETEEFDRMLAGRDPDRMAEGRAAMERAIRRIEERGT